MSGLKVYGGVAVEFSRTPHAVRASQLGGRQHVGGGQAELGQRP
ncbi:hypothetical protein [Streptomyces sp. NPDC101165]